MISYARYNSSQNWYRTQCRLLLTVSRKLLLSGRFLAVLSLVCSHSLFSGKLLPTELALKLPGRPTCASLHVNLKQKLQETVTMIMQETFSLAPLVSCSPQNSQSWDTGTYTNMIRFGHYRIELQCTVIHRPCCLENSTLLTWNSKNEKILSFKQTLANQRATLQIPLLLTK